MQTRNEFFNEYEKDIGSKEFGILFGSIDNEYYSLIENKVKQGKTISEKVYNSLSNGQKFHFNKHYNSLNNKVVSL